MTEPYRIEPLRDQDRSGFSSGEPELDRYLRTFVRQDQRRLYATAFVAVEESGGAVIGYYTLAATAVALDGLPAVIARKLPRYPLVPAVLLGRLAVRSDRQGQGLGGELLFDALQRSIRSDIGAFAAVVQPKTPQARAFYARHGFGDLPDETRMFLPLAAMDRLLQP